VALAPRPVPLHRRVPPVWWWAGALFCAALGSSLYVGFVSFTDSNSRRPWTMVPVVAAARDLPEGTRISLEMLSVRSVPVMNVTASVVKPDAVEYAVGQKLEFPLQAGDPLLWAQFDVSRKNKRFDIMKRGRAYTIPVMELKTLGGMLVPKEEVDLLMIITPNDSDPKTPQGSRAVTLLQKVRLLAVGGVTTLNIGRVQQRFTDLTFLLVPEEVEILSLAQHSGPIAITLRKTEDEELISRGETTLQTLLSGVRLKALERKRGAVISNIRAHQR
jgi:pilus assembly protein CpaB